MAIKGVFTFLEWVQRLTKGYVKHTGKQPDNLAKLKINMEAAQRVKDQSKVVDITSKIKDDWWKQRSGFIRQHPEATKKIKEVTPIKKNLSDDEATSQINKLREDFDFTDRSKVLQLLDDIDAGKAFGAFDEVQKKELRDMISKMYTHKPDFASGGIAGQLHLHRPGYSGGALVKLLNLLKGKKKNVWRGFETDYKNILKGDVYPEEFSGRFFTPDKDLAKWYAMRQGTLTGKVKKLKLTEKEIKEAQEFAEKNLRMKYGEDLLVSEELAKKATVDLPATALAKIEAVIRKAKDTKIPKKYKQKDKINVKVPFVKKASGGRVSYTKGGLAHVLGV